MTPDWKLLSNNNLRSRTFVCRFQLILSVTLGEWLFRETFIGLHITRVCECIQSVLKLPLYVLITDIGNQTNNYDGYTHT